jgi:hypothetical protein
MLERASKEAYKGFQVHNIKSVLRHRLLQRRHSFVVCSMSLWFAQDTV